MGRHFPAGFGHERHAESSHPYGLVAVVAELEYSGGFEGAG